MRVWVLGVLLGLASGLVGAGEVERHGSGSSGYYYGVTRFVVRVRNEAPFDFERVVLLFDLPLGARNPWFSARNGLADRMVCDYREALLQFYCELPSPYSFPSGDDALFWIDFDDHDHDARLTASAYTLSDDGQLNAEPQIDFRIDTHDHYPFSLHCFIATAAYGSEMAQEVGVLREFRDRYLLGNAAGRKLVDWYYSVSPPLAAAIASSELRRRMARAVLNPVILVISYPLRSALLLVVVLALGFAWRTKRRCAKSLDYVTERP